MAEVGTDGGPGTAPGDLDGPVVVLTGASRGIGKGLAQHLGALGARLVVTGRKPERPSPTNVSHCLALDRFRVRGRQARSAGLVARDARTR